MVEEQESRLLELRERLAAADGARARAEEAAAHAGAARAAEKAESPPPPPLPPVLTGHASSLLPY